MKTGLGKIIFQPRKENNGGKKKKEKKKRPNFKEIFFNY